MITRFVNYSLLDEALSSGEKKKKKKISRKEGVEYGGFTLFFTYVSGVIFLFSR